MADERRMSVMVKPNSSSSRIEFDDATGTYRAFVKASPEKGKANAELLKLVRKAFGKNAVIARGAMSRRKIIELL